MTKDTKNKPARTLLGVETEYLQEGNRVTFKHTQEITTPFMDELKYSRNASTEPRKKEFASVASLPVPVHSTEERPVGKECTVGGLEPR